jgi:CRISPR type III-A-associated protein Csm2
MKWLRGPGDAGKTRVAQRELRLLQPRLAYQARRIPAVEPLRGVLSPAIDRVLSQPEDKRRESFAHFVEFFEAIVAYGKD